MLFAVISEPCVASKEPVDCLAAFARNSLPAARRILFRGSSVKW